MKRPLVACSAIACLLLAGCDDPKQNCRDVANKYDECAPQIIDKALNALPEALRGAADAGRDRQRQQIQQTVEELQAQCQSGKFTDAEKKQFRLWRACLKKPCTEFTSCIGGKK